MFALAPTSLDTRALVAALRGNEGRARASAVRAMLAQGRDGDWERALTEALAHPSPVRAAMVNEQLTELDYLAQRWARVPRVCASVATSTSFLLASLALRQGLEEASRLAEDGQGLVYDGVIVSALNVATIGLAGAAFCIAIQMRARGAARDQLRAADALVERLEALRDDEPSAALAHEGRH